MLAETQCRITGKERDPETGLDYFGARYYGSNMGRFSSADPKIVSVQRLFDPQQWNMYAYTRNNPLLFVDPDGRELKLYIYNNTGGRLSDSQIAAAGAGIAGKYHNAGVKNVSYRVVDRVPSDYKNDGHSKFLEVTNGPKGKFNTLEPKSGVPTPTGENPDGRANQNRAYAQVDASGAVRNQTPSNDQQMVENVVEVGSHELAHGVLEHSNDQNNIMNTEIGSNGPFNPSQSQQLQNNFNRDGEVDQGIRCEKKSSACAEPVKKENQ